MIKNNICGEIKIISPDDNYHYFFGYYDMKAESLGRHLCHRVSFMDRLPESNDIAEIGYLKDRKFYKIGETTAWNFQQGAMLKFSDTSDDTIYYNVVKDGKAVTLTQNIVTGEKKYTDRAAASISSDGRYGLGISFSRIYDFRPGYGYAGMPDPYASENVPVNDGVFLIDMEKGTSRLIIDYPRLAKMSGFGEDEKVLVNHITFSPDSKSFIMLVRSFPRPETPWRTSLVRGDIDGNIFPIFKKTYASHYSFANENEIVIHCTADNFSNPWNEKRSLYRIDLETNEYKEYVMPNPGDDIHCNVSPCKNYIVGDGYEVNGYRPLWAYNISTGEAKKLFDAFTVVPDIIDIRCDLHARYVKGGQSITFDTTHNKKREIAEFSFEQPGL